MSETKYQTARKQLQKLAQAANGGAAGAGPDMGAGFNGSANASDASAADSDVVDGDYREV